MATKCIVHSGLVVNSSSITLFKPRQIYRFDYFNGGKFGSLRNLNYPALKSATKPYIDRCHTFWPNKQLTLKQFIMRKLIVLAMISVLFVQCNAYKSVTDKTYLGMTKQEFTEVVKYPDLEVAYEGIEVYKTTKRLVRSGIAVYETHFFYFKKNRLVRIDKGEQVNPRQVIDLNINNSDN